MLLVERRDVRTAKSRSERLNLTHLELQLPNSTAIERRNNGFAPPLRALWSRIYGPDPSVHARSEPPHDMPPIPQPRRQNHQDRQAHPDCVRRKVRSQQPKKRPCELIGFIGPLLEVFRTPHVRRDPHSRLTRLYRDRFWSYRLLGALHCQPTRYADMYK